MKNNLLTLLILFAYSGLFAQTKLVGFSESGEINAPNAGGMIWEMNPDGTGFTVLKNFQMEKPIRPLSRMVVGPDGNGYGLAIGFGYDSKTQVLYQYDFESKTSRVLRVFTDSLWSLSPLMPLLVGTDGLIYGCRRISPTRMAVCKISLDGADISTVYEFDAQTSGTATDILQTSDGRIVVLYVDYWANHIRLLSGLPDGSGWQDFVILDVAVLSNQISNIVLKSDGNLYFAIWLNSGAVQFFKANPNAQTYSIFYETNISNLGRDISLGLGSNDALFISVVGNLGLTVFTMPNDLTPPIQFFQDNTHGYEKTPLSAGANGDLYFVSTKYLNANQSTYLFRINGNNTSGQILDTINFATEYSLLTHKILPVVIHPNNGNLYFWRTDNYSNSSELISGQTDSPSLATEYSTENSIPAEGAYIKKLIKGSDGKYYGFTIKGGANNVGFVFRINPDGTDFHAICSFPAVLPNTQTYSLTCFFEGSDGWLYGTTGDRRIFKVNKDGTGFAYILSDLSPYCNFIEMPDGMLYWGGMSLKRMAKDGSNKSTLVNNFLNPFTGNDFCELFKQPDGNITGIGSFTAGNGPNEHTYPQKLYYNLISHQFGSAAIDTIEISSTTMGNDGHLYFGIGKYDMGLIKYDIQCGYLPDISSTSQITRAALQGSNGTIFGQRHWSGRWLPIAWAPENGVCEMQLDWNPSLGYAGRFAFETNKSATPTVQAEFRSLGIQLEPNPTSSTTELVAQVQTSGPGTLRVADMIGRVILAQDILLNIGENRFEIPANTLKSKGMYQVTLQTESGTFAQMLSVQ